MARVRAGAEVGASPRLAFCVDNKYEESNICRQKKRPSPNWRKACYLRAGFKGGLREHRIMGSAAQNLSFRSHPPPGRARAEGEGEMMHSAIVKVVMPDDGAGEQRWRAFLASVVLLKGNPAIELLGENVWQINFQRSPAALAQLVAACVQHNFSYGVLQLDAEPQWLPIDPSPKPT
jgi:hypothetical protein